MTTYRPSPALRQWRGDRAGRIGVLATGHAEVGRVAGPGRPLDVSKPLAHAYVIGMVGEFQGFVRDLHDLAVQSIVAESGAKASFVAPLTDGLVAGRGIDRGNATHSTVVTDFKRLGLESVDIDKYNARWSSQTLAKDERDAARFQVLLQLRNALGHGNEAGLRSLLAGGSVKDTVSWARSQLPVLNRYARALDHVTWDHMRGIGGKDPWT